MPTVETINRHRALRTVSQESVRARVTRTAFGCHDNYGKAMTTDNRVARNQAPPLVGHNTVTSDPALVEALTRHGSEDVVASLDSLGLEAGSAEAREHGMLANEFHPELVPFDRYGNRVDEVRFHPSWHWLMERSVGHGLQAAPWESDSPHAHLRRAGGFFAWQTEPGHGCPSR